MNYLNNRVSRTLNATELKTVEGALDQLDSIFSFAVALTEEERMTLPKINKANKLFVQDGVKVIEEHPGYLPQFADPKEVLRDYQLFEQIDQIMVRVDELHTKLAHLKMLAGSEAMQAVLMVYNLVKMGRAAGLPGAESHYQRLKERFEISRSAPETTSAPEEAKGGETGSENN